MSVNKCTKLHFAQETGNGAGVVVQKQVERNGMTDLKKSTPEHTTIQSVVELTR